MIDNLPAVIEPKTYLPEQRMDLPQIMELGEILAKSGFFTDARSSAQACVKIMTGQELGFGPMASMSDVHIIEGKPNIGAHLMAATIKRSKKYDYKLVTLTNEECRIEFYESGKLAGVSTFTMAEAVDAGLTIGKDGKTTKTNWKRSPRNMLFARAMSNGFKWFTPDAGSGVLTYTPEEMDDDQEALQSAPAGNTQESHVNGTAESANGSIVDAEFTVDNKPSDATITEEQVTELVGLLRDTRSDVMKFLDYFHIRVLPKLPQHQFEHAKSLLTKKKEQMENDAAMPKV